VHLTDLSFIQFLGYLLLIILKKNLKVPDEIGQTRTILFANFDLRGLGEM